MNRGADIVARTLVRAGVKRVFTLSGNHVMSIFDAAPAAGLALVHVRHEAASVHMADAWARLTGEVGVALATGGPGHANAVPALYTALCSESPVVLLSGHSPLDELHARLGRAGLADGARTFNLTWHDWLNLDSLLAVSKAIAHAALAREDSCGAHYREDFPRGADPAAAAFTRILQRRDGFALEFVPVEFSRVRPGESLLREAA